MKTMTFKYRPNSRAKSLADMEKAIAGKPQVFPDTVFFESLDLVDSFVNYIRAKIITTIAKHHPQSVDELAKIINRNQEDIQKEIKFLEGLGILEIEIIKDAGRSRSVPKVVYDKFIIDLDEMDNNSVAV